MIKTLDNIFFKIFSGIFTSLRPVIIIILILTLIKIIIDYRRYGKVVFKVFSKSKGVNATKTGLEISIENLKTYYKLIKLDDDTLILIMRSGIYVLTLYNYVGIVTGEPTCEKLVLNISKNRKENIFNPILKVQQVMDKLKNFDFVYGYVLLKRGLVFNVLNHTQIKLISVNAFYYHFSKLLNEKKYTDEQIDQIYIKICKLVKNSN